MGKLSQTASALNDADRLRDQIDECEKSLAALSPDSARKLMLDTDTAHQMLERLVAESADMRAEEARLRSVDERIIKKARVVVQLLGGRPAFVALREQTAPGTTARWWLLDHELDMARQRLFKRIGIFIGVIAAILVVGYIARPVLFPEDPVGDAVAAATNAMDKKDLPAVEAAIDIGLTKVPTSTELLIWKGYLYERAGNEQAAQTVYDQALKNAESDKEFLLQRSIDFMRMGEYARVVTDTTTIIQKYPDSAEGYYMRASGYEGLGERKLAMADLEKCGELAQAAGNDPLYAQSRVRLATLMQAGQ